MVGSPEILVVDSKDRQLKPLADILGEHGIQTEYVTDGYTALERTYTSDPFLVVYWAGAEGFTATEYLDEIRNSNSRDIIGVIVVLREENYQGIRHFMEYGADDCISIGGPEDELLMAVTSRYTRFRSLRRTLANQVRVKQISLKSKAYLDPVTGLPNELAALEQLQKLSRAKAEGPFGLFMIEIGSFQRINDSFGPDHWEAVQKEIISRLKKCVPADGDLYQFRNHEFGVLLPLSESGIMNFADNLLLALNAAVVVDELHLNLTPSIGISAWKSFIENSYTYLFHAKAAKDLVREQGGNHYRVYSEEIRQKTRSRLVLQNDLFRALRENELCTHYQPQIDLGLGKIVGLEALLRWPSLKHGQVSPMLFIPAAEEAGLIYELGRWVLEQACLQSRIWQSQGHPPIRMAVNISPRQFFRGELDQIIAGILKFSGLPPEQLELEITEGTLIKDRDRALQVLNRVKSMGVHIAIDDFGTGYASLAYLKQFPIDTLKIDRSFIRRISTSKRELALARTIIELAKQLGLRSVAEGVETIEQARILKREGCDFVQGFYFSPPVSDDEVPELFTRGLDVSLDNF